MTDVEALPDQAYAAALLELPELWPNRFGLLLGQRPAAPARVKAAGGTQPALFVPSPALPLRRAAEVWELVTRGAAAALLRGAALRDGADPSSLAARWAAAARDTDVARVWAGYVRRGTRLDLLGDPGYPPELAGFERAPSVLFRSGPGELGGRRVAIIGTRQATAEGRDIACELGEGLSSAGVRVVSGLARGIDALAHQGAVSARGAAPIGVVAGGFDVPYPARNRVLWERVAAAGVLVSEWPLGTRSLGWRFPARNRIIAALAEVVVIVESAATGGSMLTASLALDLGVEVMAVPGSPRNPVAAGTNLLLRDGAAPVTCVGDVLAALQLPDARPPAGGLPPDLAPEDRRVLEVLVWDPTPTDRLITRSGLSPVVVATALAHLEMAGVVVMAPGGWCRAGPLRGAGSTPS
ncbi:MAG: DNA-processing protein DprA [Acidimicrobiales bacterium]